MSTGSRRFFRASTNIVTDRGSFEATPVSRFSNIDCHDNATRLPFNPEEKLVTLPKSYKGLRIAFENLDDDVKGYLVKLGPLLNDGKNYEIALAYCFMKLEEGHHRALKCGLVRLHDCASEKVDSELEKQHFTAEKYASVFKNVFSSAIPSSAADSLSKAQAIRNKLIHGKKTTDPSRRDAMYYALQYMNDLGEFVRSKTEKNPYGDLRGLAGKKKLLPPKSTIWMLKGFGLDEKTEAAIA